MPQLDPTTPQDLHQTNDKLSEEVLRLKAENQWLKEQLGLAKHRLFAPKTEASPPGQEAMLFNEAEVCAAEVPEPASETITYTRRKFAVIFRVKLVQTFRPSRSTLFGQGRPLRLLASISG